MVHHSSGTTAPAAGTRPDAGKPVIALKLGASAEGRAAALAHTGAVAGAMEEFDTLAVSADILRVRTLDEAREAAAGLLKRLAGSEEEKEAGRDREN